MRHDTPGNPVPDEPEPTGQKKAREARDKRRAELSVEAKAVGNYIHANLGTPPGFVTVKVVALFERDGVVRYRANVLAVVQADVPAEQLKGLHQRITDSFFVHGQLVAGEMGGWGVSIKSVEPAVKRKYGATTHEGHP